MIDQKTVFVTGGGGYVGAVLVPALLEAGYGVKALDLFIYGEDVLDACLEHPGLEIIKGDIRDRELMQKHLPGCNAVIHLACISNDPSYELDPDLGRSINYDAFVQLVPLAKENGVKRFIYASSSSVYGIKDEPEVTEYLTLEPLTDYSKYKAKCEEVLLSYSGDGFVPTVVRPSTVCGYSPRQRLDLTVNILTNHAINKNKITVFGGAQKRPNLHIKDMVAAYLMLLEQPEEKIKDRIYNVGYQNYTVMEIAELVKRTLDRQVDIEVTPSDDIRSYHVSSRLIQEELGFTASHTIEEAIQDLEQAFAGGKLPDPMENSLYFNIKRMQDLKLA